MDCLLTVKGGQSGAGSVKHTKTAKLEYFVKDSEQYYRLVNNHLKSCDKCDPGAVATLLWERRYDKKSVSNCHVKQQLRLEKMAAKSNKSFPHDIVTRSIVGNGYFTVINYPDRVPIDELFVAVVKSRDRRNPLKQDTVSALRARSPRLDKMWSFIEAHKVGDVIQCPKDDEELDRLAVIAQITGS